MIKAPSQRAFLLLLSALPPPDFCSGRFSSHRDTDILLGVPILEKRNDPGCIGNDVRLAPPELCAPLGAVTASRVTRTLVWAGGLVGEKWGAWMGFPGAPWGATASLGCECPPRVLPRLSPPAGSVASSPPSRDPFA